MKLKILSYNIHKGFDWKNQSYYIQEMKKMIQDLDVDIVFLQEVVGKNEYFKNKGMIDEQFEFLADGIWEHFSYAQNAIYDHGHHGNLILSKFPISSWENINISTKPWEKRGMLVCKIVIPDSEKYFYATCLHLNLFHSGRKIQYRDIGNYLSMKSGNEDIPLVVAGDFNDWNKQSSKYFEKVLGMKETHKMIHGYYAKTFPSVFPLLCLDRIYVKHLKIVSARLVLRSRENPLSDHLPLLSEVEFYEK